MVLRARVVIVFLVLALRGNACLWDYDTLRHELHDRPSLQDAIAGRIDVYPPEYYTRRIQILRFRLSRPPVDLDAIDSLAVAYDRLGNDSEAIKIIQRKRALPCGKEAQYRAEANEATFRIHRWLSSKGPTSELISAKAMIEKALLINPNAHFGREKAQLIVVDWLISGCKNTLGGEASGHRSEHPELGMAGLTHLGSAWESIDILEAIATLSLEQANIGYLARKRIAELQLQGKKSLCATFSLDRIYGQPLRNRVAALDEDYAALRNNAEKYRHNLRSYILRQLRAGKHPDTDPDFWSGYVGVPRYQLPDRRSFWPDNPRDQLIWLMSAAVLCLFLLAFAVVRLIRTKRLRSKTMGHIGPR